MYQTRTTLLHPQSDDMVERFNWTLADELAKYCSSDQQHWDLWLPFTLMMYQSAKQKAAGYTPARIMFGRKMQLPLDQATERPPGEELPQTAPEFVVVLQKRMEATRRQVSSNLHHVGQASQDPLVPPACQGCPVCGGGPRLALQSLQETGPHSELLGRPVHHSATTLGHHL